MKVLVQVLVVAGFAALGAVASWWVIGPPDRAVPCIAADLQPGEVCLADIQRDLDGVLWVDARPRADWQRDGLPGSVLVTDHRDENLDALVAEAFPRLVEARRVVVYCADKGCGSSKAIANTLRGLQAGPEVVFLHGGWRAMAAAGMVK